MTVCPFCESNFMAPIRQFEKHRQCVFCGFTDPPLTRNPFVEFGHLSGCTLFVATEFVCPFCSQLVGVLSDGAHRKLVRATKDTRAPWVPPSITRG